MPGENAAERLDPVRHDDVLLAAREALANAVELAHHRVPAGELVVGAAQEGTELRVEGTDVGTWKAREQPDPHRGRGCR